MSRFPAALVTSLIGAVLFSASLFLPPDSLPSGSLGWIQLGITLVAGIVAAALSVRNPKNAGKGAGEGAVTGLITSALTMGFCLIGGLLVAFFAPFDSIVHTQNITIEPGQGQDFVRRLGAVILSVAILIAGIFGLGLATGLGAITGLIAHRKPMAVTPMPGSSTPDR